MDDDWKPHKVNGPNDDGDGKKRKASIVFLPVPQELKDKGIKAVTYARTLISIDYNGKIISFTVYRNDVSKTKDLYDKELDHEIDAATRREIWTDVISTYWLSHIYTEEDIEREAIGGIGHAEALLQLTKENCRQIFKDEYNVPHAAVMINEHLEVLPIDGSRFKNWLRKIVLKEFDVVVRAPLIDEVVNTLISDAEFDGESKELNLRIAGQLDKWFYDLTNVPHEFIEITSENWKITKNEIIFRRFNHQKSQDYPAKYIIKTILMIYSTNSWIY